MYSDEGYVAEGIEYLLERFEHGCMRHMTFCRRLRRWETGGED